jgi:hypothetical protein
MSHADGSQLRGGVMTVIFGLAGMLAIFALGFVLGRVWEIRQDLRCKTESGALRAAGNNVTTQISDRFFGGNF